MCSRKQDCKTFHPDAVSASLSGHEVDCLHGNKLCRAAVDRQAHFFHHTLQHGLDAFLDFRRHLSTAQLSSIVSEIFVPTNFLTIYVDMNLTHSLLGESKKSLIVCLSAVIFISRTYITRLFLLESFCSILRNVLRLSI